MNTVLRLAIALELAVSIGCREAPLARAPSVSLPVVCVLDPPSHRETSPAWMPVAPSARVSWADGARANDTTGDRAAVLAAIEGLWGAWARRDARAYGSRLASDVIRAMRQTGRIERGARAVVAALPREWEAFEREGSELAVHVTLHPVALTIDGDAATARYALDVDGGTRWGFDDRWAVLQGFERIDGHWRLVQQSDGSAQDTADEAPLRFDFAYPVTDLARAVRFYRTLLGEPVAVGATRATFVLGDARVYLDTDTLGGAARVRPGLPNGYVIVRTPDLDARLASLPEDEIARVTGVLTRGADRYAAVLDPAGNALVFEEAHHPRLDHAETSLQMPTTPSVSGPCADIVRSDVEAWRHADDLALSARFTADGAYTDDRAGDGVVGRDAIGQHLRAQWTSLDRSAEGLAARFEVSSLAMRSFGAGAWVSYVLTLTGTGPHPTRASLLVTQHWRNLRGGPEGITAASVVRAEATGAVALALDYTGAPTSDMARAASFYGRTLAFGTPYRDERYVGYWGADAVFGVYEASREEDGIPVRGRANAYASFWVRSIEEAYGVLRGMGAGFPSIGAIVNHPGIDVQPGYRQVLATDSEGNALLLTEYTRE